MNDSETQHREHSDPIPVPESIRGLLLGIVEGWRPAQAVPPPVVELRYKDHDLSGLCPQISFGTDRLIVTIGGTGFAAHLRELLPLSLDGEFEGILAGGASFRGSSILRVSLHGHADMTIEASSWNVFDGPAPSLWIGSIENAEDISSGGNLVIERVRSDGLRAGRRNHFRFSGSYTYYVVQTGSRTDPSWYLLIDTGSGQPNHEIFDREFLLLQFVFGRQLRLSKLLGVTPDRRTVASVDGSGTRENMLKRSIPPVPLVRNNDDWVDESWTTVLFERVTHAWRGQPQSTRAYTMAMDSYLDAMTLHLDADYLRLQIALEAFAYWSLRLNNQGERTIVQDKAVWKRWVKDNSKAIRSMASHGFEENLFNKVIGAYRLSSGRVVPSAFLAFGVALTNEMMTELEARDLVVHQGLMTPDDYDGQDEINRIGIVRVLLVALLGKAANYEGAINGWDTGHAGYAVEPDQWWNVKDADREAAQIFYVAEEFEPKVEPRAGHG